MYIYSHTHIFSAKWAWFSFRLFGKLFHPEVIIAYFTPICSKPHIHRYKKYLILFLKKLGLCPICCFNKIGMCLIHQCDAYENGFSGFTLERCMLWVFTPEVHLWQKIYIYYIGMQNWPTKVSFKSINLYLCSTHRVLNQNPQKQNLVFSFESVLRWL